MPQTSLAIVGTSVILATAYCAGIMSMPARAEAPPSSTSHIDDVWRGLPVKTVAECQGVPIYQIGHSFFPGVSPDFSEENVIQEGQVERPTKIHPKKSWEISNNNVGLHFNHPPLSIASDFQPFLGINLLDGDLDSSWCSRGVGSAVHEPAWVRIDFPREVKLSKLVLHPRRATEYFDGPKPYGECFPNSITVKTSTNGREWSTLHEALGIARPAEGQPYEIQLPDGKPAKQLWIVADDLRLESGYPREFKFMLAEVEAYDEAGTNVASAARGATVAVSSTNYGHGGERAVVNGLWPSIYDLGVKWVRLSGWANDPLLWHNVERKRGVYDVDPVTDEAVTQLADNGVNVLMVLGYGNWQYGEESKPNRSKGIWTIPFDWPPMDLSRDEAREGFKNYARFMAKHFRGRVACYEIWNEPNLNLTADGKAFAAFAKEVAEVIREEDLDAQIMSGSIGIGPGGVKAFWKYLHDQIDAGILSSVDAFGWHPSFENYADEVERLRARCKEAGSPDVTFMITETGAGPYGGSTELSVAKSTIRNYVMNAGLGIMPAFWNDAFETQYAADPGILRNGFSSDPVNSQAPKPVYYLLRTLATVMDNATPGSMPIEFSVPDSKLETYQFAVGSKGVLYAVWMSEPSSDKSPSLKTNVLLKGIQAGSVTAIDVLNGVELPLEFEYDSAGTKIGGVVIRDYPLFLRASGIVWTGHLEFQE